MGCATDGNSISAACCVTFGRLWTRLQPALCLSSTCSPGPGGWDVAAHALGLEPLGIEWDDAACATRAAAGLRTVQADVAELDPVQVLREHYSTGGGRPRGDGHHPLWGLIASPPCQAFSMAGKGEGRKAIGAYRDAIDRWMEDKSLDRAELDEQCGDERAHLVLEPLRWAFALRPRWVACEQVEPVLPLWEAMAAALRRQGYQTWTGVLSAEQYGVPQTRRRAILLASLDGPVGKPAPTHQRYIAPRRRDEATLGLFDAPEPERIVAPEDRRLLPWISMAEALGWAPRDRYLNGTHEHRAEREASEPAPTLHFGRRLNTVVRVTGEPWEPEDRVGFPRRPPEDDVRAGDGEYRERDLRSASEPAFALTEKTRSWIRFRSNDRDNATERRADEPAPTITGGHDHGERRWIVDTGNTRSGTRTEGRARPAEAPAPVVTSRADQLEWRDEEPDTTPHAWASQRPSTTVAGDPRVFPPGHKINADDERAGRGGQRRSGAGWTEGRPSTAVTGTQRSEKGGTVRPPSAERADGGQSAQAVRVSLAEALVLQSFPPDYPVQGTKTKQFEQVGNAVPPLLAWACLTEVLPAEAQVAA